MFVKMLCLSMLAACGPAVAADTEASFRAGASHAGVYSSVAVQRLAGARWKFQTDGPVRSSPTFAGGLVLVGSADGRLYALDEKTGKEVWRFQTQGAVDSSAAVAAGVVYVTSRDRNLYALELGSGKQIWRFSMREDLPLEWGFDDLMISSPAVHAGRVFVGGGDGTLWCLAADSGRLRWAYHTAGRIRASPAVAGGMVFQGSMDGVLYALDEAKGGLRWKYETEGVGIDLMRAGFDRRSITSSAAVADGIVTFGSRDAHQYGLAAKSGRLLWRVSHPVAFSKNHEELAWVESSPALAGGLSFVGSSDGYFVNAVDTKTGHEKWRTAMPSRVISSPAVTRETLYVGCADGQVFALETATGREVWRYQTADSIYSSPAVHDGLVSIGSDDGAVYALSAAGEGPTLAWKAVYWDGRLANPFFGGGQAVHDHLAALGYSRLEASTLPAFLRDRIEDRTPSAIVFASDALPAEALDGQGSRAALIRRYLDSGGRVIWLGGPLLALKCEAASGKVIGIDRNASARILGIASDSSVISTEELVSRPTPAGTEWGFPKWWIGSLALPSSDGLVVFGVDPRGRASAWMKRFGERGEFVRFWGRERPIADLDGVVRLVERTLQ